MNLPEHQVLLFILLEKGNAQGGWALLQAVVDEGRVGQVQGDVDDVKIDAFFQLFEISQLNWKDVSEGGREEDAEVCELGCEQDQGNEHIPSFFGIVLPFRVEPIGKGMH